MRTTVEVTIKSDAIQCDFCDRQYIIDLSSRQRRQLGLDRYDGHIRSCAMCNKDCCPDHTGQSTEDGDLCMECSKKYFIAYAAEGGVGIKNIETGEWVKDDNL